MEIQNTLFVVECTRAEILRRAKTARAKFSLKNISWNLPLTHVNSKSSKNQTTKQIFRRHEQAKKPEYLERILEAEHGTFTALIFGTNGCFGDECKRFLTLLAYKLSEKNGDTYCTVITWLRTLLSMEITRASLLCLRGSRTPFRHNQTDDVGLENMFSGIV